MNFSRLLSFAFGFSLFFGVFSLSPTHSLAAAQSGSQPATNASNPDSIESDETLNLTQEQKDKIQSIREDAKKQKQDVEKDKTLTPDQQAKQLKQINKQTRAQVFAVLTPEQQKAWSEQQRQRRLEKKQAKSGSN